MSVHRFTPIPSTGFFMTAMELAGSGHGNFATYDGGQAVGIELPLGDRRDDVGCSVLRAMTDGNVFCGGAAVAARSDDGLDHDGGASPKLPEKVPGVRRLWLSSSARATPMTAKGPETRGLARLAPLPSGEGEDCGPAAPALPLLLQTLVAGVGEGTAATLADSEAARLDGGT
jgi:hypothetical protein